MPSLPPRIHGEINVAALLGPERRPWSVARAGQLLPGRAYRRSAPRILDTRPVDKASRVILGRYHATLLEPAMAIHCLELTEALVFGQGSVVLADGQLLHESAREFVNLGRIPDGAVATDAGFDLPPCDVRRLEGRCLLVKRPWYRNSGHWLVDLMSLVPLCVQSGVGFETILFGDVVEGPLRRLMEDVARVFAPRARVEFLRDDEQVRCETLVFVEPVHMPPHFKHPIAIQAAVDACRLVTHEAGGNGHGERKQADAIHGERIYVSRQRAAGRVVSDAAPLEAMLAAEGFATIFPEDMGIAEQVAAFEGARMVVGVKGAGLTNVMFSRPGTRLLLLSPADFIDPFFWDLATQRGLEYSEIFFRTTASSLPTGRADFAVDPEQLRPWFRLT